MLLLVGVPQSRGEALCTVCGICTHQWLLLLGLDILGHLEAAARLDMVVWCPDAVCSS